MLSCTGAVAFVIAVLLSGWATASSPPAARSVAISMATLDEDDFERLRALELERSLVVRLIQEGYAVVPPSAAAEVTVSFLVGDQALQIVATTLAGQAREASVELGRGDSIEALHLEIVQKVIELVRIGASAGEHAATDPEGRLETDSGDAPAPRDRPARFRAPPRLLAAGASAVYRGRLDPALAASAGFGGAGAARVVAATGLTRASEQGIGIHEWHLQAGAAVTVWTGARAELEAAVLAGFLLHHFTLGGRSGVRLDLLVSAPISLTWWSTPELGVRAVGALGLAGRAREHTQAGAVLWSRSAARFELGAGVVWRPRRR